MTVSSDTKKLQIRLSAASVPLKLLFARSGVDRSTFSRWRAGQVSPTLANWEAVQAAANDLAPINAPKIPAPENTAAREDGSSPHPIPDTELSPQPEGHPDQSGAGPLGGASISSADPRSMAPTGAGTDS